MSNGWPLSNTEVRDLNNHIQNRFQRELVDLLAELKRELAHQGKKFIGLEDLILFLQRKGVGLSPDLIQWATRQRALDWNVPRINGPIPTRRLFEFLESLAQEVPQDNRVSLDDLVRALQAFGETLPRSPVPLIPVDPEWNEWLNELRQVQVIQGQTENLSRLLEHLGLRRLEHPLVGRDEELTKLERLLEDGSVLIVGPSGVGKTFLVRALASRLWRQRKVRVARVAAYRLEAGSGIVGVFERRVEAICQFARKHKVILFIDEFDTVIGTGVAMGRPQSLADYLLQEMDQGLRLIACLTDEGLKQLERHRQAKPLLRRFSLLRLEPVTPQESLRAFINAIGDRPVEAERWGQCSWQKIGPCLRDTIDLGQLRERLWEAFQIFPSDRAMLQRSKDDEWVIIDDEDIYILKRERSENGEELLAVYWSPISALLKLGKKLLPWLPQPAKGLRWIKLAKQSCEAEGRSLTTATLAEVIAEDLGVPYYIVHAILSNKRPVNPDELRRLLERHVVGQDEALAQVVKGVDVLLSPAVQEQRRKRTPYRPLGVLLFHGPSGVGKTLTAKLLAEHLFGPGSLLLIDMTVHRSLSGYYKLLGNPATGDRGELTVALGRKPCCVILFDEFEKAPELLHIFLPILYEGRIVSELGEEVYFSNALIILATNAEIRTKSTPIGFVPTPQPGPDPSEYPFMPYLMGRIDYVIPFRPLTAEDLKEIVRRRMESFNKEQGRLRYGLTVALTPRAIERLVQIAKARDKASGGSGAREIDRAWEEHVLHQIDVFREQNPNFRGQLIIDFQGESFRVSPG